MKLKTLNRILNWFNEYQGDEPKEKMIKLYKNLIEEEEKEIEKAIKENNLVEILDAIWDVLWVNIWYAYFWWVKDEIDWIECRKDDAIRNIREYVSWDLDFDIEIELLDDIMNEIADSNYTKVKEKQTEWEKIGKIKKWPNFKKPDIQRIIDKYNLDFKK